MCQLLLRDKSHFFVNYVWLWQPAGNQSNHEEIVHVAPRTVPLSDKLHLLAKSCHVVRNIHFILATTNYQRVADCLCLGPESADSCECSMDGCLSPCESCVIDCQSLPGIPCTLPLWHLEQLIYAINSFWFFLYIQNKLSARTAQQHCPFRGTTRLHQEQKIKFIWESFLSGWLWLNWWQFMAMKWRQRHKPYYELSGQQQIKFEAHRRPRSLQKRPARLGEISFYIARVGELIYKCSVQRLRLCEKKSFPRLTRVSPSKTQTFQKIKLWTNFHNY